MSFKSVALGDVCSITGGGTPSKSNPNFYIGDIPWATVRDMNRDNLEKTDFKISKEAVKESSTNIIPKNNVIIATRVGLGKVCIIKQDTAINQDLRGVVPKNEKLLDVNYLFYWFKSISKIIVDAGRGATVHGVTLPFVKSLQIPLPPLSIQKKIVVKLDAIFSEIEKATAAAEANVKNVELLFQSYLTQVFERSGEDFLSTTLGNYYDVRDGTHDSPKFYDSGYPLVTSKNLKNGVISFEKIQYVSKDDFLSISQRSGVKKGDVLMAMIGTIGNPVVIETDAEFAIKNVALFKTNINQSPHFLRYYLGSDYVIRKMEKDAKGATQKFVGLGYLRSFPINVPPIDIQISVVKELEDYERHTKKLLSFYLNKLNQLLSLKQSILKQAFNGELVKE